MANVVENRVVEMEFDNKDFEKNAATSISTLDKLKEALQFKNSSKGFTEIQNGIKNINFSPIQNSISDIDNAFMNLAGSIKRNFFDEIAREAINVGKTLYNNTIGQIMTGGKRRALNIEQAQFKVKGLGADWDEVYKDMDYAVSGTAYGIDQAANAASQFLASGVQTGEDMKAALRGISGIAAMTSSSYDDIAQVFTAAAGKGRVQAEELNRISLRGVNAAAALAEELGTTEDAIRDMASKGEISFNQFAKAMDNAFGEHAKKANETFSGSLSNVKAALSRIGEIFYAPYIRGMIPVFNELRLTIDKVKNALKFDVKPGKTIQSIATALETFNKAASGLSVEVLKTIGWGLDSLKDHFGGLYDKMKSAEKGFKRVTEVFRTYNRYRQKAFEMQEAAKKKTPETAAAEEVSSATTPLQLEMYGISMKLGNVMTVLDKDIGTTVGNIIDNYKLLYNSQKSVLQSTTSLFSKWSADYKTSFKKLNKNLQSNKKGLETLSKDMATLESKGASDKFIQNLKNMGTNGANIVHALAKATDKELQEYMKTWDQTQGLFDTISEDWTAGAKKTAEQTLAQVTGIPEVSMDETIKTYDATFKQMGISSANGYANGYIQTYEQMEDQIANLNSSMLESSSESSKSSKKQEEETEELKDTFDDLDEKIWENITGFTKLDQVMTALGTLFTDFQLIGKKVWKVCKEIAGAFVDVWNEFNTYEDGESILNPLEYLIFLFDKLVRNFKVSGERADLIRRTFKGLFSIFELGKFILKNLLDALFPITDELSASEPVILRFTAKVGDFIHDLVAAIVKGDEIPGFIGTVVGLFGDLGRAITKLVTGGFSIPDFFSDIWNAISEFFSGLTNNNFNIFSWFKKVFNFGNSSDDDSANGIFGKFVAWLDGLDINFDSLFEKIKNVLNFVGGMISDIWGVLKNHLGELDELLSTIIGWINNIFESSAEESEDMGPIISAAMDVLLVALITARDVIWEMKDALGDVLPAMLNVITAIANMFSGIANWIGNDPEGAYGMAAFFALIVLFTKILEYKTKATKKGNLISMLASITGFFDEMKATVKEFKRTQMFAQLTMLGNVILKIAAALAGLVAVITGGFNKDEKVREAGFLAFLISFAAIGALLLGMVMMIDRYAELMEKNEDLDFEPFVKVIDSIAGCMFKIGIAMAAIIAAAGENWGTALAAGIGMAGILAVLGVMVVYILKQMREIAKDSSVDADKLNGASEVMTAIGTCVSMLATSIIKIMAIMLGFIAAGADIDDVFVATAEAAAIVGLLLLALASSIKLIFTIKIPNPKKMWALIALIAAITLCVKLLVMDLVTIAGIFAVMPDKELWKAFAMIAAIMVMISLIMVGISWAVSSMSATSLMQGLIGVAVMFGMVGVMMLSIATAAGIMQAAGVTEDTVDGILKIIAIVGLIMIAIGILSKASGAGTGLVIFATGLVEIAIATIIMASAIWIVIKALAVLIATFTGLALVWPQISDTVEGMLTRMKELLPIFLDLIADFIIGMCLVIIKASPMIAAAIVSVIVSIFIALNGWIPGIVESGIEMLDRVVTALLKGAVIILPKLLALLLLFLAYLDANAEALGYMLGSVLSKIVWGALKAVLEFLIGTALPDLGKAIVKFFKGDFVDQVTDMMMSDEEVTGDDSVYQVHRNYSVRVNGKLETQSKLKWYNKNTGKYYDTKEEAENAVMEEEIDKYKTKGSKDLTLDGQNVNMEIPSTLSFSGVGTKEIQNAVGDTISEGTEDALEEQEENKGFKDKFMDMVGGITSDAEDATAKSGDTSIKGYASAAKDAIGGKAGEVKDELINGFLPTSNDGAESAEDTLSGLTDGLTNPDVSAEDFNADKLYEQYLPNYETGADAAEEVKDGYVEKAVDPNVMNEISAATDAMINSGKITVDPQYDVTNSLQNSLTAATQFGNGTLKTKQDVQVIPEYDYSKYGYDPSNSNALLQGTTYDTNISYSNSNIKEQADAINNLQKQLDALQKSIDNCIIMPKDSKIDITAEMDSTVIGKKVYPVINAIQKDSRVRAGAGVSTK